MEPAAVSNLSKRLAFAVAIFLTDGKHYIYGVKR